MRPIFLESAWLASLPDNISFQDAALVRKTQEGGIAAFEQLVLKYQDRGSTGDRWTGLRPR